MIFGRKKKEKVEERKQAVATQIEQLKEELDNNVRSDYKEALQSLVTELASAHLTESTRSSSTPKK